MAKYESRDDSTEYGVAAVNLRAGEAKTMCDKSRGQNKAQPPQQSAILKPRLSRRRWKVSWLVLPRQQQIF